VKIALVYWDMKFALEFVDWDNDPEDVETIASFLKALIVRNKKPKWNIVMIINPLRYHIVHEGLLEAGFADIQKLTWCKSDAQVMQGVTTRWVSADETIIVAHVGQRGTVAEAQLNFDPNPLKRYNWFLGPTQKTKLRNELGQPVNVYEKPPWLAEFIGSHYVKPGDTCIVLGAGAGGDVKGLVNLGCDVIAFENDERQIVPLIADLINYEPKGSNKVLKMTDIGGHLQKSKLYDDAKKSGYKTPDEDAVVEEEKPKKHKKRKHSEVEDKPEEAPPAKDAKIEDAPAMDPADPKDEDPK